MSEGQQRYEARRAAERAEQARWEANNAKRIRDEKRGDEMLDAVHAFLTGKSQITIGRDPHTSETYVVIEPRQNP